MMQFHELVHFLLRKNKRGKQEKRELYFAYVLFHNTDTVKNDLQETILVEGLKLDGIKAGMYMVHCLHLRLLGAEGSPIRCILIEG